jgi:AhpD family alkylhydroperoxidase
LDQQKGTDDPGGLMGHHSDVIDDLKEPTRSLRDASPEVWAGFGQLHKAAIADGVLSARFKELIALTVAVVKQCDGCIAYHAKAAARRGATAEEVAEALGVALLMDGGPASVYAPRAWEAYQEFAPPQPAAPATADR